MKTPNPQLPAPTSLEGRVFSRAALEAWQPPDAEIVSEARAKHRAAGQLELALEL